MLSVRNRYQEKHYLVPLSTSTRNQSYIPAVFRIRIHFLRIRIQRLRLETYTDPDPDPIRIQGLNDQKFKKNYSWKKNYIFLIKNCNYLSLGLHKVCPGYRRSLQLTEEAIQHFKTWIFSPFVGHFCHHGSGSGFRIVGIWIRIHWPDWIRIQSGSGSRSGSETLHSRHRTRIWGVLESKLQTEMVHFTCNFMMHRVRNSLNSDPKSNQKR